MERSLLCQLAPLPGERLSKRQQLGRGLAFEQGEIEIGVKKREVGLRVELDRTSRDSLY